ncbi:MAG: GntR family transcriptional regulator [Candidatus Pelethousia sp.]|nr:GntR family transcriptional regulator [Candidatus Pelethousia sp.]
MGYLQEYEKKSLSEVTVTYIKDKILSGEFKSGDKLIESEISGELGISRAPVREAMRQLNVEGMVVFLPRKGNHVLDMALAETMEVFEIRTALEKQILEMLVTRKLLSDADISNLKSLVEDMRRYEDKPVDQYEMLYQLNSMDIAFHRYLWNASGSFQRPKILEKLFYELLIVMNRDTVTLGTFKEKAQEHLRIVQALAEQDLDKTLGEFDNHMKAYIQAVKEGSLA